MPCHAEANGACPAVQVQYNARWLLLKSYAGCVPAESRSQDDNATCGQECIEPVRAMLCLLSTDLTDGLAGLRLGVCTNTHCDPVSLSAKQVPTRSPSQAKASETERRPRELHQLALAARLGHSHTRSGSGPVPSGLTLHCRGCAEQGRDMLVPNHTHTRPKHNSRVSARHGLCIWSHSAHLPAWRRCRAAARPGCCWSGRRPRG